MPCPAIRPARPRFRLAAVLLLCGVFTAGSIVPPLDAAPRRTTKSRRTTTRKKTTPKPAPAPASGAPAVSGLKAPVARREPVTTVLHGDTRVDDYAWLRDDSRTNPEVLAHLTAENDYTAQVMKPTEPLQNRLFEEIKARTKETDLSVPYLYKGWYYYSRTETGKQYAIFCRRKGSLTAAEEIYLDQNLLAAGHDYCRVGALEVSLDSRKLAFTVDTTGAEEFTLFVKDLETGQVLADQALRVNAVEWATDGRHLFYTVRDDAKRAYRLFLHELGAPAASDVLVYEENDALFDVFLFRTRSDAHIIFGSASSTSTEAHFIPADRPGERPRLIQARQPDHEYHVDHRGDRFYIRTNWNAKNFRLVSAPVSAPDTAHWEEVLPHRPEVLLDGVDLFKSHWVTYERVKGLPTIQIRSYGDAPPHAVEFPDQSYSVYPVSNVNFDTPLLRFSYQSLTTPGSIYDYNVTSHRRTLLKQVPVLGGYKPDNYVTERVFARASDGAEIPISLAYRKDVPLDGTAPLLLYGYAAYGFDSDPSFSHARVSLLDRGVIYAIAHVRGGNEMGELWHDQGKMMYKRNTFTDFIACAENLINRKYTSSRRLAIHGGSAGGLLVGAVVNMRPDLFQAVVADVPFVDVLNTMLDASLPLTVGEYLEWGNPNEACAYHYMKTYCPYTNVSPQRYPAMLVTAGLNDPRVSYWEAAKWVAKLRAAKPNDSVLILRTNMGAGHSGASGRYDAWKEQAFRYAFVLTQLGVEK